MIEKLHHTLSKLVIEADLCHAEQKELADHKLTNSQRKDVNL